MLKNIATDSYSSHSPYKNVLTIYIANNSLHQCLFALILIGYHYVTK